MKKISKPKKTRVAVIFLGSRCNMNCRFCITDNAVEFIPFDVAVNLFRELTKIGVKSVVLGGGEPFVWPHDVVQLSREAKALNLTVQVGTNGIALPEDFAHIDSIDRYVLPLDAARAEFHDRLRVYPYSHHRLIMDRLQTLKQAGKSVTLSTIFTRENVDDIPCLLEYIRQFSADRNIIHAWHLYKFLPRGREGLRHAAELLITDEEYQSLTQEIIDAGLPFRIYRRTDMYHTQTVGFFWYRDGGVHSGVEGWNFIRERCYETDGTD